MTFPGFRGIYLTGRNLNLITHNFSMFKLKVSFYYKAIFFNAEKCSEPKLFKLLLNFTSSILLISLCSFQLWCLIPLSLLRFKFSLTCKLSIPYLVCNYGLLWSRGVTSFQYLCWYGLSPFPLQLYFEIFLQPNDAFQMSKYGKKKLDLTRSSCKKCNYRPSGRNRTCDSAISVQRSNQLSYRETVVEL